MAAQVELQGMEVYKKPPESVALSATPMDLLRIAVSQNFEVEKLARLMDLQREWEKNEAKKAFDEAKAAFKAEPIRITKDKENKQYGSRYTSIGNLVDTVNPYLSKHGLSADWEVDQTNGIKVTCNLTHRLGHKESRSMTLPADKSGQKNPLQEIKSAITYGRIVTYECATGLASNDPKVNPNDDGNGFGNHGVSIPDERYVELRDGIENASSEEELKRLYLAACAEADKVGDQTSKRDFNEAKKKAWGKIHAGR